MKEIDDVFAKEDIERVAAANARAFFEMKEVLANRSLELYPNTRDLAEALGVSVDEVRGFYHYGSDPTVSDILDHARVNGMEIEVVCKPVEPKTD